MILNRIYWRNVLSSFSEFKYHITRFYKFLDNRQAREPAGGIDYFPEKFSSNNSDLVEQLSSDVILFDGIIVERVIIANITLSELLLYSQTIVWMSR